MQNTLIKIGNQILASQSELAKIISTPNVLLKNKKGEVLANKSLNIIFDLDENEIIVSPLNIDAYDREKSPTTLWNVNSDLWGRRGNPLAVCMELKKIGILARSMSGEFANAVERNFPHLKEKLFFQILEKCKKVEGIKKKLDKKYISDNIKLNRLEKIIMVYVTVKSTEDSLEKPTHFKDIEGYQEYIKGRFLGEAEKKEKRLCYATGKMLESVGDPELRRQAGLTNIFQTTLFNNANGFDKKAFSKNYQLDASSIKALDTSIEYIKKNLGVKIAGINHHIIPHFLERENIDLKTLKSQISKRVDLLFLTTKILDYAESIEDNLEEEEIYWVNFIAYDTDGNYYKIVNQIVDVSNIHLTKVSNAFRKTGKDFYNLIYHEKSEFKYEFNLQSTYFLIPVRENDKEKKNEALLLFKQILENRKVDIHQLYKHFIKLIIAHWFHQDKKYSNIRPKEKKYFGFAVRESVFKYLALFSALQKLNLLKNHLFMEATEQVPVSKESVKDFFARMGYNSSQKAMFYLGRVLNSVARAQAENQHESRPVLNKINYNGMNWKAIMRFRIDLREKVNQYGLHKYHFENFGEFTNHFPNEKDWKMTPEEAVFFILSGYSFFSKNQD